MTDTATTGPITLDDVRAALAAAGIDPRGTNAGALRRMLGRGSLTTLQRHLDTLRSERTTAERTAPAQESTPAPAGLVEALWSAALAQAQAHVATAHAAALTQVQAQAQEIDALRADMEAAQQAADEAATAAAEAEAAARAQAEAAAAATAALGQAQQAAQEHARQIELLNARHEAAQAALRGEIERMLSQLADYKAALHQPSGER